jgi:choline dehydrogenase-like flavoprotein
MSVSIIPILIFVSVAILKSMKEFSCVLGSEMLLPPNYAFKSDESLAIWVKTIWHTTNHYMGTTKMGTSKKDSVCDSNCKLWKVDNVYFADAGVMPLPATGHTSVPTFIIGKIVAKILHNRFKN